MPSLGRRGKQTSNEELTTFEADGVASPTSPIQRYQTHLRTNVAPRNQSMKPTRKAKPRFEPDNPLAFNLKLYFALDPYAQEVILAKSKTQSFWNTWTGQASYSAVRNIYRQERMATSNEAGWQGWASMMFSRARIQIYKWSRSKRLILILSVIEFFRNLIFCLLYIAEMTISIQNGPDKCLNMFPHFAPFLVCRAPEDIRTLKLVSVLYFILLPIRIAFADNVFRMLKRPQNFLELILSVAVVAIAFMPFLHSIYIPYFLFSLFLIPNIKLILRSRSSWRLINVSNYMETLVILLVNIILILFLGVCFFNFFENNFGVYTSTSRKVTVLQTLYYMVITLTTVGYGDIVPKTDAGKISIMILILVGITVLPGLVADTLETFKQQKSGAGSFSRTSTPYYIVCGDFRDVSKAKETVESLFQHDRTRNMRIVLLGRQNITPALKIMLGDVEYRYKVEYLRGTGLTTNDLRRVDLLYASGAFILANESKQLSSQDEDDRNVLRAWAFDDFSPETPLYVETLYPETESLLKKRTAGSICLDELKQLFFAYNCLYRGVGTLLANLLQRVPCPSNFNQAWEAQYADGALNSIYEGCLNPIFIGVTFSSLSHFLYVEFQVILFGVNIYDQKREKRYVCLNPGLEYCMQPDDSYFFIAHSQKEVDAVAQMTSSQYKNKRNENDPTFLESPTIMAQLPPYDIVIDGYRIGYPPSTVCAGQVPLCYLLTRQVHDFNSVIFKSGLHLKNHILVCTGDYNLFYFISTLRSAYLSPSEFKTILILCSHPPTQEEFEALSYFPKVFIKVGNPQKYIDLEDSGIINADKIVITNMCQEFKSHEGFADSPSIMVAHLIYDRFQSVGKSTTTIVDLDSKSNIKFLRPAARRFAHNQFIHQGANEPVSAHFAPVYAAGQVLSKSMLETALYAIHFQPFILSIMRSFCGINVKTDNSVKKDVHLLARLCYIAVPPECAGQSFANLYKYLCASKGIVPIGLLRDEVDSEIGNRLPFVITNPMPSFLIRPSDLVYVLANRRQL